MFKNAKFKLILLAFLTGGWLLTLSAAAPLVFAQTTSEARVTSVSGRVLLSGSGRSGSRLVTGTSLVPGDELDTRGGGRAVIDLTDGSQIVVLPGSRIVIGDYRTASSLRELLQITLGRIRVRINHFKGQPNPYRLKSPTASIAVRGTEFEVVVKPLGETLVTVSDGAVEVASLREPDKKLVAEPAHGVIVRPNFTIEFFVGDALTKEAGERENSKSSNAADQKRDDDNGNLRSASNVYERSLENIVESGETALPARFTAFPDAHLDSLENPAYADGFTTAEGRLNFLPSFNGSSRAEDDLRDRYGLGISRPIDFSLVPAATFFIPVPKFRAVIGGSAGYLRNGLQSLSADENSQLISPPFAGGASGFSATTGSTSQNLFNWSLIAARKFGKEDQTSIGLSFEQLSSRGSLNESLTQRDTAGMVLTRQIASHSSVNRTRFTFGLKHDLGSARFGMFYRYGASRGNDSDLLRIVNGAAQPNDLLQTRSHTSELGFRLRGVFSRRLFYGAEVNLLFGRGLENYHKTVIADSTERDRTGRGTIAFGLGYLYRPGTIFSFDAAAGIIGTRQSRTEDLTGTTLETERGRVRFFSFHAAVQKDLWRSLFGSVSILSITQSRATDSTLFPDRFGRTLNTNGISSTGGLSKDFYTDLYSNFGLGWKFKPNLIFQYVLTTDFGQTSPRHTFFLRYTFNFKKD